MKSVNQYFKPAALVSALLMTVSWAHAQQFDAPARVDVPEAAATPIEDNLTPALSSDTLLLARIDRLEIALAETRQMLQAQRVLSTRNQMKEAMDLRSRLEMLESQLSGVNPAQPITGSVPDDVAASLAQNDAIARSRLNELEDATRIMRGQIDALLLQFEALNQNNLRARDDSEFRFQQLENAVRKIQDGGVSTAAEPQVLGRIRLPAPVVSTTIPTIAQADGSQAGSLDTTNAEATPLAPNAALIAPLAADDKLIGEGEMPVLGIEAPVRPVLQDPKQLYERALADLRKGLYVEAEADFRQILTAFPAHNLAGNAQYWLGETHYVRQDYKGAAEAFLAGYTTYAKSSKAPDSLLKLGITLFALNEQKTGCDALAELGAKFPEASQAIVKRAEIEKRRAGCQG